jgi:hypothetical protein
VHNFYNQSAPTPDSANPIQQPQTIIEIRHIEAAGSALKRPAWSGPFEPGRSSGVYGGQKLALRPSHADCAIQISAQQPRIEIDVLNLRSAGDLTIFRSLAFIEIPLNLVVSTKSFSAIAMTMVACIGLIVSAFIALFVRVGFDVADGIKIAFEFLRPFLPAKETNSVLTKPEPNAVESIDDVYPVESLARVAPPVTFRSHRLVMPRR